MPVEVKLKATSTATPSAIKPLFFSFLEKMVRITIVGACMCAHRRSTYRFVLQAFFREGSVDFSSDDQLRHHVESALVRLSHLFLMAHSHTYTMTIIGSDFSGHHAL